MIYFDKLRGMFHIRIMFFMGVLFVFGTLSKAALANTVITSPIDSRPISTDYLKNLADIAGDTVIYPSKEHMDYFSANDSLNHFADSEKIREEIRRLVSENNNNETTVIINTSTYFSNGLVGSRCGINYKDNREAVSELESLVKDYPEPKYYINLSMPRTLPETRFNEVWHNDKSVDGIGYYYLKYNPKCENREYISQKFKKVTPVQFIMEYSYLYNKRAELGDDELSDYELEFLKDVDRLKKYEPYKSYLYSYKLPYFSVADMFLDFMLLKERGLIDEIVISNDDFQLPESIIYFNSIDNREEENNSSVKFSFARTYMSTGVYSITKQLVNRRGESEALKSLKGKSDDINFIFGTDELPQLIYARDLAKRSGISADFNIISDKSNRVETFDVASVNELAENASSFVYAGMKKSGGKSNVYIYNYNTADNNKLSQEISEIEKSIDDGNNTGIIEIYSNEILNTGENALFKTLLENDAQNDSSYVSRLASYSAWNTNANAVGLGIAHTQVYAIAKKILSENISDEGFEAFTQAQVKMLTQHLIEDGVYTCNTKRILSNEGFVPAQEDLTQSKKLVNTMAYERVLKAFENKSYFLNDKVIEVKQENLKSYGFPWGRTFECFLDFDVVFS